MSRSIVPFRVHVSDTRSFTDQRALAHDTAQQFVDALAAVDPAIAGRLAVTDRVWLCCDASDCEVRVPVDQAQVALPDGWAHRGNDHFCPDHHMPTGDTVLGDLIQSLRQVHQASDLRGEHQWCVRDEEKWPCETVRLLNQAQAQLGECHDE